MERDEGKGIRDKEENEGEKRMRHRRSKEKIETEHEREKRQKVENEQERERGLRGGAQGGGGKGERKGRITIIWYSESVSVCKLFNEWSIVSHAKRENDIVNVRKITKERKTSGHREEKEKQRQSRKKRD